MTDITPEEALARGVELMKRQPGLVIVLLRAFLAVSRPGFARLHADAMAADALYRESEVRRTGKQPAPGWPEFRLSGGQDLAKNLNYYGFTMAQNALRLSSANGLLLSVDQLLRSLWTGLELTSSDEAGPSYGDSVRLTKLIRATTNGLRHGHVWSENTTDAQALENMATLRRAGVVDPLQPDVPIIVLRIISPEYFGFEDAVMSACDDLVKAKFPGASADAFWGQFIERPFTFAGKFTYLDVIEPKAPT